MSARKKRNTAVKGKYLHVTFIVIIALLAVYILVSSRKVGNIVHADHRVIYSYYGIQRAGVELYHCPAISAM